MGAPSLERHAVTRSFTDHEYTFSRGDECVATVSKRWFGFTDIYGVEIADGEDDIMLLDCTVVIDIACHPDHRD
jgi:uncharacterized protein YxjI